MVLNRTIIVSLVAGLCLAVAGCKKEETPAAQTNSGTAPSATNGAAVRDVSRVHWLGKKKIAADLGSAGFMEIWKLSESARLEKQTLDKLAVAPWRLLKDDAATNGAPVALLRALLDDVVNQECYLEIHHGTNQTGEVTFAIQTDDAQGAVWQTNLSSVLQSLYGATPAPPTGANGGWRLSMPNDARRFSCARAGDWTVISLAKADSKWSAEFANRLQQKQAPFATQAPNSWMEMSLSLSSLGGAFLEGALPGNAPQLSVAVAGDGQGVQLRGELDFPKPLPLRLDPWKIPTNLVHEPLIGFGAVRGVDTLVEESKFWDKAALGKAPSQAYFWAQGGAPWYHYWAMASPDASKQLQAISERVIRDINPMTSSNNMGSFERTTNSQALRWRGIPFFFPNLDLAEADGSPFLAGGFYRLSKTNSPPPEELLKQLRSSTNLVWYDWEITQPCLDGLMPMLQLSRRMFASARLGADSAGLPWLQAIPPKLGNTLTAVTWTKPNQLTFVRRGNLGLTGFELHLLTDWLESPNFPRGLHTTDAPPGKTALGGLPPQQ